MPGPGPFYLAMAPDGSEVVLKLLQGDWTNDAAARDRFTAEAASARRVPPFCAARILDAGVEDGYAYLVSEYVSGASLLDVVSDGGRLRRLDLEALAIGSATGLASVHEAGLVHGSFGPEYLVMSAAGPRVIEFGIIGPYGAATPSADMLAWAQTMIFASMGRPLATLADVDLLPEPLRDTVANCLTGDPSLRPTARSVVQDLIDSAKPSAQLLAEGARRCAEVTYAAHEARAQREFQQTRGSRAGTGGRAARAAQHHGDPARRRADGDRAGRADPDGGRRRRGSSARDSSARDSSARDSSARDSSARGSSARDSSARDSSARDSSARDSSGGASSRGQVPGKRSGALPIAAGVVVIAAVAFVIVHVMQNATGGNPSGTTRTGDPPSSSTSPVSSTVTARTPPAPAAVPAAFAGSWSGEVTQPDPTEQFEVKLSLAQGSADGSISYSSQAFSCSGDLSLKSASPSRDTIVLSQDIVTGQTACANGIVTLTTGAGSTTLTFRFRGKSGPQASGTLTQS